MAQYTGKKVGVVLSGCGVYDGTEIQESVITLLTLDKAGAKIICMAPDIPQMHVINHIKGEPVAGENRNVLIESARIVRSEIKNMKDLNAADLNALIFPGGYGAAKNLSTFAVDGVNCKVNPEVERLVKEMHGSKKPLGFICIAPVLAAKILGKHQPKLTIGNDAGTAQAIEKMGGKHIVCKVDEIAVDEVNKIVTTPAYMLGPSITPVSNGIEKCVMEVLKMMKW
jgi:enhancing lycopene biosynthesis protein 2